MKKRVMVEKRVPKYFHRDGNGVHLKLNNKYMVKKMGKVYEIDVIKEFRSFYLVLVDGKYRSTVNKICDDFEFL